MDFAHYTDDPVGLAVALVNSFGWVSGSEALETVADLERLVAEGAGIWASALPAPTEADLERVRELRRRLRTVFDSEDVESAAAEINDILRQGGATPHLATHGEGPHLHFEPAQGSLTDWLAVITAMGLATVIADHGMERLGVCAAAPCRDVFIDTSRNRSRLHCSDTCRTRENVAAHRQRRRRDAD